MKLEKVDYNMGDIVKRDTEPSESELKAITDFYNLDEIGIFKYFKVRN